MVMVHIREIKNTISQNIFGTIIVILFLFFFFALNFNYLNTPWERDEGEYAYSAWLMQVDKPFYVNSFLQKPPLIIYTYYLGHLIKPFALWPPRLLGLLFTLASCVLLSLIAKKIYGAKGVWLALWISPLFLCFPPLCALAANTEKFMLLPLIGLLALFVFKQGKTNKIIYFWAGALAALAILYKPIALPVAGAVIIYWLTSDFLIKKNIKKILGELLFIILGGVTVTLLVFLYPLANGAIGDFWQQVVIYNSSYAADMGKYFPEQFLHYLGIFWNNLWPILLLVLAALFLRPKLFGLWFLLLAISLVTIINIPIGHYYLLITPFLILLAAGAYSKLSAKIKMSETAWKVVWLIAFLVITMSVFFSSLGEQFFLNSRELSTWIYGQENPFVEANLMADKVKANTKSGEKIFVAGSEPQIYYFSQRESISKFDITYPFNINTPWREGYQRQGIKDWEESNPVAVVVSLRPASSLWEENSPHLFIDYLSKELKDNYYLVGGTALTINGEPLWLEPEIVAVQEGVSLLLYLKK
jgi:hypothetical protein